MPEAARLHDAVSHTDATAGFLTGAVAGAAAAFGAEALVGTAVAAGAVSGGIGFVLVMGLGALACWGLPKLGAMAGRQIQRPAEGEVLATSPNIVINGLPAAHTLDPVSCHSGEMVAQGSQTVIFNGQLAARAGDRTTQGGVIVTFSPNVIVGGPTGTVAPIDDIPAPSNPATAFSFAATAWSRRSTTRPWSTCWPPATWGTSPTRSWRNA